MLSEKRIFMCNGCNREFLLELEPSYVKPEDLGGSQIPGPDELFCPYCCCDTLEVTATPEDLSYPFER